jgi:hypothetical protein
MIAQKLAAIFIAAALASPLTSNLHAQRIDAQTLAALAADGISLVETENGIRISASPTNRRRVSSQAAATAEWIRIGDALVPGKLMPVIVNDSVINDLARRVETANQNLSSEVWEGILQVANLPIPRTDDGRELRARTPQLRLPSSPVSVLHEGYLRGVHLAVLAITPLHEIGGQLRMASEFTLDLPGVTIVRDTTDVVNMAFAESERKTAAIATAVGASPAPATNPYAASPAWLVRATATGIMRVTGSELSAKGAPTAIANICVRYKGQPIPIHALDGDSNNVIAGGEEIRFYAPSASDRYNNFDTYWISNDSTCARKMTTRGANLSGAPVATTAREKSAWNPTPTIYYPSQPGADNDHWFSFEARTATANTWNIALPTKLPLASGLASYTVFGNASDGTSSLGFSGFSRLLGNGWNGVYSWSGRGAFSATFSMATSAVPTSFKIEKSNVDYRAFIDHVKWDRPVSLAFGNNGARFSGELGAFQYELSGAPEARVYDITDPNQPIVVSLSGNRFQDSGSRDYIVAGNSTLATASLEAHSPPSTNLNSTPLNKKAVYVAPQSLISSLQPLIDLRNAQGIPSVAVPAEWIYAYWSFGQVSPVAIRNFLRHAYSSWSTPPEGVVLVGDASSDVRNFLGWNFTNLLPPYFADVDPYQGENGYLGETACEACFAQLNGNDPLSERLPDLIFGRLPVKSVAQLQTTIAKIVAYENNTDGMSYGSWRHKIAYLTDNAVLPNGTTDGAGNFWVFANTNIAEQNLFAGIQRLYYDPIGALGTAAYRIPAPVSSQNNIPYQTTKNLFNSGAGAINYIGHGSRNLIGNLSDPQYNNGTVPLVDENFFLERQDADSLTNSGKLPILVQMTCLTSAFHYVDQYVSQTAGTVRTDTSLDERLLLAPNGIIAAWGSTGLGVAYGHEALLRGFYKALWSNYSMNKPVGSLAQGGYVELFLQTQNGDSGYESLQTYLIMGDPFTRARIYAPSVFLPANAKRMHLPIVQKQ